MSDNNNSMPKDYFIPEQINDSISQLKFYPSRTENILASGGWDCKVRIWNVNYAIQNNSLGIGSNNNYMANISSQFQYGDDFPCPILSICWQNNNLITGLADGSLYIIDIGKRAKSTIYKHGAGCKEVLYNPQLNLLFSGGWDGKLNIFDLRQANPVMSYSFNNKIYTMSNVNQLLVIGLSERVMAYFNLQKLQMKQFVPECTFESHLKYQTRKVCVFTEGNGFAEGSIEGRVAIKYINLNLPPQINNETHCITSKDDFAFRCHRNLNTNPIEVYPVNDIAFNPVYGTFATVGGDGSYIIWDKESKSRLKQGITNDNSPLTSCDYNGNGDLLAYSIGYDWSRGIMDEGKYNTKIGIHYLPDIEKKKKPK